MDIDDSSILGVTDIDKSKLPPIHQKRILAFVNNFIISTCSFLNNFSAQCETRFIEVERKIQKVEATLMILESKLSSISGLDNLNNETSETEPEPEPQQKEEHLENKNTGLTDTVNDKLIEKEETSASNTSSGVKACEDARYRKYFKMMQFGVPPGAVKVKMQAEGFDPNILDTPNLVLEDGIRGETDEPS